MAGRLETALGIVDWAARNRAGHEVLELAKTVWDVPLQVRLSKEQVIDVITYKVRMSVSRNLHVKERENGGLTVSARSLELAHKLMNERMDDRSVFPLKQHSGAATKTNLFLRDVAKDAGHVSDDATYLLALVVERERVIGRRVWNDEASAWLAWLCICEQQSLPIRALAALDYNELKELSDDLKAAGVAASPCLNLLVEAHTLIGRGAIEGDLEDELRKRTQPYSYPGMLAPFRPEQIREAVRRVVREEQSSFDCPDWETFWRNRFATTKAGAHNRKAGMEDRKSVV